MNATLRAALEEACEFAETDWVIEFRGRPVGRITKGFKRAVRRSRIAPCTIHDLRRTCASWLLQEDARFTQVAAYLGDAEAVIRKHYGMFAPDWLRAGPRASTPKHNSKVGGQIDRSRLNSVRTFPLDTQNLAHTGLYVVL